MSRGDATSLGQMAQVCERAAARGALVRVFFRDESIPAICRPEVAIALTGEPAPERAAAWLEMLARAGDVRLYACSSSLYLWGIGPGDLLPCISGSRGLIAFLAEDLTDADEVLSY